MGICLLSRQYGINVTTDAVEEKFKSHQIDSFPSLEKFFLNSGIKINLVKLNKKSLSNKTYILPAIAISNNGAASIVTTVRKEKEDTSPVIQFLDPLNPSGNIEEITLENFLESWSGRFITVTRSTGHITKDKFFDMSWFYPEFFKFRWVLALTFIISLLLHALSLSPIIYIQITLDKVLGYGATETLYVLTGGVLLALVFNGILTFIKNYIIQYIALAIEARISGDTFDKMLELPIGKFQTLSPTDLEGTVTSGSSLRNVIERQILNNVFETAGLLVFVPVLIGYSPVLALLVLAFSLSIALITLFLRRREATLSIDVSGMERKKNTILRETINGIDSVKVFSLEKHQAQEWRHNSAIFLHKIADRYKVSNLSSSLQNVLQQILTIILIFTGVLLVFSGSLSAGAIISCNMLAGKITGPTKQLVMFFAELSTFKSIISRVAEVWNSPSEREGLGGQRILKGNLELKEVTVLFDNVPALNSLTCRLEEGKKIAIVGPAGSGKSTLLRLFQGLLRPNKGVFTIDGVPHSNINLENYRAQVALISQNSTFFNGTIESNLRLARPNISEREYFDALTWSGLQQVLDDLPEGISTNIDQYASGLSSSHKLIISLARAIISNPKILLLDEIFSNIDKKLGKHIFDNLNLMAQGRTLVVATHDISLIKKFDNIIVLNNGSLESDGNHEELLNKNELYKSLYQLDVNLSHVYD